MEQKELIERIERLKRERNAVILAHYYTRPEVQDVADFVGDSLALSRQAAGTGADVILFAGVYFMAETAKTLSPGKTVLIPDPKAGCSLAKSCDADEFSKFLAEHPGYTVVSYVNTTTEIKAMTDIVCTSGNAVKVIDSLPEDARIIFGPDRNLGEYIKRVSGRKDMLLWYGGCHVHNAFSPEKIAALKAEHPQAEVLVHPEAPVAVQLLADFIGSTAAMIGRARVSPAKEFIVVTEPGILHPLRREMPDRIFYPAPSRGEGTKGIGECNFMKKITLEKIAASLEEMKYEVVLDEELRRRAERSILRMLEVSK